MTTNSSINKANQSQAAGDNNLPRHPQPNQPQTEGERRQQLQEAHLENQDASVKLPEQQQNLNPEHKEMGDTNNK
ncbi:hypothetical protein ACF3NA_04015 [Alkanindiges sp. WGS2144]|uniref:hypothetical protein n=1 Tax=Alkanindiges sp. WGS2144 TaxID=3366808 RepID=UPI003753DF2D